MFSRIAFVAAGILVVAPVAAAELPVRKAGLWELRVAVDGVNDPDQTMEHCTDQASDKAMMAAFSGMQAEICPQRETKAVGNTIVIESVCRIGPITMNSRAVISGDFNSAYVVKVVSKRSGGPTLHGVPEATNMTIDAKWAGACKPGQRPGDIVMPGGVKMNINEIQRQRLPGAR